MFRQLKCFWLLSLAFLTAKLRTYVFHFFSTKTLIHAFFISSAFCQLSLSVALLFHRASNIVIIILRHILYIVYLCSCLYIVYLCSCLGLGLFMSYLCDLFLIFSLILIVINRIISFKQTYLFFWTFFTISPINFGW